MLARPHMDTCNACRIVHRQDHITFMINEVIPKIFVVNSLLGYIFNSVYFQHTSKFHTNVYILCRKRGGQKTMLIY